MRHETTAQQFRRYALLKLRQKRIQLSRNGLLIDIGIIKSWGADGSEIDNYYIRYGTDDDFLCWVEGAWMGQAVRRFIRTVKSRI